MAPGRVEEEGMLPVGAKNRLEALAYTCINMLSGFQALLAFRPLYCLEHELLKYFLLLFNSVEQPLLLLPSDFCVQINYFT